MRRLPVVVAIIIATVAINPAKADTYSELEQFAQSICGDIPAGNLTRTVIQGEVRAKADVLTRILSGSAQVSAKKIHETYIGIPWEKLPDSIPTVSMCKLELMKIIYAHKAAFRTCRLPAFGLERWARTEDYTDSSGKLGGGYDENWWCNRVIASFLQTRSIGPQYEWNRLNSHEESSKDWLGHVTYKYYCTVRVSWDPIYDQRQDPLCGLQ